MPARLFSHASTKEARRLASFLRDETTGGVLLLVATVLALICANLPQLQEAYQDLRAIKFGPETLHLNLSLNTWAADGLLAIFFFVAGLELKREFIQGDLSDAKLASVPVAAACGGVVIPAIIYMAFNAHDSSLYKGWAIPTATDIAFALAILSILNNHLPNSLRTFLLTLAVVDDLIAIVIIAVFYTSELHLEYLGAALIPLIAFAFIKQKHLKAPLISFILAFSCWALVHASGIHATLAGVLLAFMVPVTRQDKNPDKAGDAERLEHLLRPISAGFAVPVFAFMSAGVTIGSFSQALQALNHSASAGVIVALVVGKPLGIFTATFCISKMTRAELDPELKWLDVLGVSILAGVGFTVSLLMSELAFGSDTLLGNNMKFAVLLGSAIAAGIAAIILKMRDNKYRLIFEQEQQKML